MSDKRILITSAHPDDLELGMGMRVRKFVEEGFEVMAVTATKGEYSDSPGGRVQDEQKAAKILGIREIVNLELPCANLLENAFALRSQLERIVKELKPSVAYTIYPNDLHIDHQVLSNQSLIAFRSVPEFIYYKVAYSRNFHPNLFFFGDDRLFAYKLKALKCFSSEITKGGTIDLDRTTGLSLYEYHNYLHHSLIKQIVSKTVTTGKTLHAEFFEAERLVSY